MKKPLSALLALVLALLLCACSGGSKKPATGSDLSGEELQELIEREARGD